MALIKVKFHLLLLLLLFLLVSNPAILHRNEAVKKDKFKSRTSVSSDLQILAAVEVMGD